MNTYMKGLTSVKKNLRTETLQKESKNLELERESRHGVAPGNFSRRSHKIGYEHEHSYSL